MVSKSRYVLITSERAQKEVLAAIDWYDNNAVGQSPRFIRSLNSKLKRIELNPELYASKSNNHRETKITAFPYLVIYKVHKRKKLVVVTSVFHTALNPKNKYRS